MNIAKILKDCPKGTKLYSPIFGECTFIKVKEGSYPSYDETIYVHVQIAASHEKIFDFAGRYGDNRLGECLLFPSKDNRDWSTFKIPKQEHEFKPFEKVLVRDTKDDYWRCQILSHIALNEIHYKYICLANSYKYCIPYEGNEHLLGTTNNPEK